jgi:hypothetical protein
LHFIPFYYRLVQMTTPGLAGESPARKKRTWVSAFGGEDKLRKEECSGQTVSTSSSQIAQLVKHMTGDPRGFWSGPWHFSPS